MYPFSFTKVSDTQGALAAGGAAAGISPVAPPWST